MDFLNQMDQIIGRADDEQPVPSLINRCRMNILLASCCERLSAQASDSSQSNLSLPGQVIH